MSNEINCSTSNDEVLNFNLLTLQYKEVYIIYIVNWKLLYFLDSTTSAGKKKNSKTKIEVNL